MVAVEARRQPPPRLDWKPPPPPPPPPQQPLEAAEGGVAWTWKGTAKQRRERNERPADGTTIQADGGGRGATVEEETEIELMVDTMQKKIPTNTKGLFLPKRNCLKNFTIPKRTVEKDFLTECSPNERDYSEVKQHLNQSFLDTEFNFENFWQIDKIEMVQNKHLEEEFVAKRAKLREEGKQDKELSSFLIVSNDEVSQICQNGLQIGHSRKQLKIMNELGNPQLGVYLFRYVDVALNYASSHSTPVENIIIFRVLLGKVKKVEPPKGKTKIALDPTPNFDCHMSRVHPSLKDSLEDQAISSLVYFYEYNEVPKPVDKPRQCLPYAVIKVKNVNWKMQVGSTRTSLKCRSKRLPKHVGRYFPLQNTTVVTRIGKSKLIYEHFRKPVESFLWRSAEDSENSALAELCSSSGRMQNWNGSSVETQHRKAKHSSSRRWDLATNELTIQGTPGMDVCRDIISDHMGNKPSKMHLGVSAASDGGLCTVTTSRSIKDPRLTRREQILRKENEETAFHESSQYEKELEYNLEAQISATVGIPYIVPEESFLLNSKRTFSQRQYMEKITWKENSFEECVSPPLLNSEQGLSNINNEVVASLNTYTHPVLETHLNNNSFKFKDIKSKHSVRITGENLNGQKGIKHSELHSLQFSPYKTVGSVWIPQDYQPGNKEHGHIIEPSFCDDNDKYICKKIPEGVTASENKMGAREEVSSGLHDGGGDDDDSEKHCAADLDTKYVANNCTSSEREHGSEYCSIQDNTLQSEFCEKLNLSENVLREVCTEDKYICERSSDEMSMQYFEQNELQALTQSEKSSTTEVLKKTGQIYSASENAKPTIDKKKEHIVMELKESAIKERISNINCTHFSNTDSEMLDKTFSCRESIPEVREQVVEVKCEDVQHFKVASESEDMWEGYKKCLSVPEELHDHENMSGEEEDYHFLQKRMDWDNLFGKPNLNTNIPGNPSVNENVHECLHGGKSGVEKKETGSFNTVVYPDLEITITCSFHSKLKKETWKCAPKYLGQKQNIKWLRNKTMKKYTEGQKNSNFYLPKKQCSSETFSSLSKRQIKKILQSEKHLKNILNTLNREAILCKNKYLSQKIGGALFHLRKAQRRVHSLKVRAKARKKKSNDPLPKIHRVLHNGSLPSDSFVTSGCLSDLPCSSDNERNITRTEVEIISEKSTLNTGITNTSNHEYTMNNEQNCVKFTSRNIMKDRVATVMGDTKQNLSSEDDRCTSQNTAKQLNPSIIEKEFVSHVDKRKGESISDRKTDTVRFATTVHTALESSAEEDVFTPGDTSRLSPIFMSENDFSRENQIMEIVSARDDINMSITAESYSAGNNLSLPSPNYSLQEHEEGRIAFLETKEDFSGINQYVINDILVKPLMKTDLDQKNMTHKIHITPGKESSYSQTSSDSSRLHSSLLIRPLSEQHVEAITASSSSSPTHYDVLPTETKQKFTSSMTRLNENSYSSELPNFNTDLSIGFKCTQAETEVKSLDFKIKIPEILQKADETSSLNLLHEQIISCKCILPVFLEAFQEKQGCSFQHVLVSREIIESAGRNLQPSQKLNPCAIESLVELQIVMETIEFIENKKRCIGGEPTFRSLLWYDSSLCSELFGGQAGYQQQSNLYPTFQKRLKYSPLNELQSYHKELVDVFENTRWEKNSYYTFLKARREIEECEAAMKSNFSFSDFYLSVPFVCGANFGDTLEDLEAMRKNTIHLMNLYKSHPGISLSAEKENHFWIIMEIIGTKMEFIRTCEEVNIKASLFGLEHIFFDAAKSLVWKEKEKSINGNVKDGQMLNQVSLSTVYETYEHMIQRITKQSVHQKTQVQDCITDSLAYHDICCIGEILEEAQFATIERLEQLMCNSAKEMERLKKYFLALQEEDASVLIEIENVLGFMKSDGINPVILKPEAVEVYTEMAMIYETVFYLKNSIAIKVDKPRFRSLLWFDLSLLPELFRCQEKMASLSYRKDNLLKIIESSISELQEELNVIYDYSENLNCPYALHLLTRELTELSETRNLLKTSKSPISMCVDLVPYTICLNYGSTVYELECNYNQFSSLLEKLMLAERKDLGKMAHIMKIMKTIEHMKFVCSEQGKSPLPVAIHQMLKNWRKARQLKRQDMKTNLDDTEGHSTKYNSQHSQAQYKRPVRRQSQFI